MKNDEKALQSLISLGLTDLEARIYTFLLQESPVTGYRIAQALGKPSPNVYTAIQTLEAKGAVEVDHAQKKICRPLPARDLLDLLEGRFKKHRDNAADSLRRLPGPADDTRIYQLRDRDQVFARFRRLLEQAKNIALLDLFPETIAEVRSDIDAAIARGVTVIIKVYADVEIPGAEVVLSPRYKRICKRWPVQWINMSVDGSDMMIAVLTSDTGSVIQAVWTSSPILSWIHHVGLGAEIALTVRQRDVGKGIHILDQPEFNDFCDHYLPPDVPGFNRIQRQLGILPDEASGI
jgi:sugar-specific transcriptional regulator TrmB